jgi:hypothetical protein
LRVARRIAGIQRAVEAMRRARAWLAEADDAAVDFLPHDSVLRRVGL